jgi:hypothetical protein
VAADMRSARRLVVTTLIALSLACAVADTAIASPFRRLVRSTVAFATDGTRYAAWQVTKISPVIVLDTRSGKQRSFAGCSIEGEEERSAGQLAAAGRFLAGCEGGTVLLNGATGAKTRLPEPPQGEWRAVGARYAEGSADRHACGHSRSEEQKEARGEGESELTCIALYSIASGVVSYRPESQVPDLDRAGAPDVCSALRTKLFARGRFDSSAGGFAFGEDTLVESVKRGEASGNGIRIRRCDGHSKTISAVAEPRDLFLLDGLLTWDTGHAGADLNAGGASTRRGRLWSYQTSTGRRDSLPLPQTTIIASRELHGVFGYSAHAGRTLFWIAATKADIGKGVTVEASAIYAATL